MAREITTHKVNPVNDRIVITAEDLPNPQNFACHKYKIGVPPSGSDMHGWSQHFNFQDGPIAEVGVNGITHEALIAILLDRLYAFQEGPYKCRENALAITKLEEAQQWLFHRTLKRMQRGVEGTHAI